MPRFFIACAKGIEPLLFDELQTLGLESVKQTVAGCYVETDLRNAYRICLWSRLASRVLLELGSQAECDNGDSIRAAIKDFPWEDVMTVENTFIIEFSGSSDHIRHTQFGAQLVKDGIVDRFRELTGERPSVTREQPQLRFFVRLHKQRLTWSLDLSGEGLHKRGYRLRQGGAPLRENLAAAVLYRAGISDELRRDEPLVFDPFCGSGTLLIEAALMALDQAPGLYRDHWGFRAWRGHRQALWQDVLAEAKTRMEAGRERFSGHFYGSDSDPMLVKIARENAERLQLAQWFSWQTADATAVNAPAEQGLLVTNPPYGERLGEEVETLLLYRRFGRQLREHFSGWHVGILAGDDSLLKRLKLRSDKKYPLFNGALSVTLARYDLTKEQPEFTESQSDDFSNRIKKNHKKLSKWARGEGLDAWRVYDADLPDYNAAIDFYQDYLVVQEYAAPKAIPDAVASDRLWQMIEALPEALDVAPQNIILKKRQRQQGSKQYQRNQRQESVVCKIHEYGATFEVNLTDYLDTGLFLDHRWVRKTLQQQCDGLRVLNLFAYTCTASVHAALGGAERVVSVDMSKTYLSWGKRNFSLNRLQKVDAEFIQADCIDWLQRPATEEFDVIFLDPPTFSNSKRMDNTLDVQRDHVFLLKHCLRWLDPEGVILFSNNRKKFKLDEQALKGLGLEVMDKTQASIPPDFARHKGIHHYYIITREQ